LWLVVLTGIEVRLFLDRVGFGLDRKQKAIVLKRCTRSKCRGIPKQGSLIALARKQKPRRARSAVLNPPLINIAAVAQVDRPMRESLEKVVSWFRQYGSAGSGVTGLCANLGESNLVWLRVQEVQDDEDFTVDFVLGGDHSFVTNGIVSHNTPFHTDDLYGDLAKNPQYEFRRYQAIKPDGKALWPERYSAKRLADKRSEIGSIRFTREFQCEPVADDMSLFPGHLFKGDPIEQPTITLGMPLEFWSKLGVQVFVGVDFAMSSSVQADYTVIFVLGLDKLGNRWIIAIQRERGMGYQEQLSLINTIGKKYRASLLYLEANQMQRIFGDELIRTTDLPVKQFVTGVQKNSLDKGVPSLRVMLENKKFRIPRGDKRSVELTDLWINEMRSFTWVDGKLQGVGSHDDMVMACWIADQAVRQGAFGFSFGDEMENGSLDDTIRELTSGEDEEEVGYGKAPKEGGNGKDGGNGKATGNLVDGLYDVGLPPGLGFRY
jgi:hypothetical protein